ncbi:MAG: GNAT family N-acetyltransferase [Gaiellales bacterium]
MPDVLRPMRDTAAELDRVDDLLTIAYETSSRRRELELYLAVQPDGWFVIEQDDAPVAVGGCIAYGPFCWLGLVATHPDVRGRGLARRISQHLVEWAREHGCCTVALDASAPGRPVYERLGFETIGWTIELAPDPAELRAEGARAKRATPADVDEIVALDPAFFGGDRHVLLRSLADPCFVTRDRAGRVGGYLFARERLIGPGMAPDADAAAALVRAALALPGSRRLLVPAESAHLTTLESLGLVEQRRLAHMRLGRLELPGARDRLIAELSFATG